MTQFYKSPPVFIDAETAWSKEYSLKKMPIEAYIRHENFKTHIFGCREGHNGETYIVLGRDVDKWLKDIRYEERTIVAHNAFFDAGIIAFRHGKLPKKVCDTISMSRWVNGKAAGGHSLANLAKFYGLPSKGTAVHQSMGQWDLDLETFTELSEYCKHDVDLCASLFYKMLPRMSPWAVELIDWTARLYLEPRLHLDVNGLLTARSIAETKRQQIFSTLGVTRSQLRSNDKFAQLLRDYGYQPRKKSSPTGSGEIWAFAKTDKQMHTLLNHHSLQLRRLAKAKLIATSNIEENRLERLADVGTRGAWPVPLNFCGAQQTCRWSGAEKLNAQNLPPGPIRDNIMAPPGHKLVVVDSNKIELRVAIWLAEHTIMMDHLTMNVDPYVVMAKQIYGRDVEITSEMRKLGKICMLALNYGMGLEKFITTVRNARLDLHRGVIQHAHKTWRATMVPVTRAWENCENQLKDLLTRMTQGDLSWRGQRAIYPYGLFRVVMEPYPGLELVGTKFIIKYPGLHLDYGDFRYRFPASNGEVTTSKLWGGVVFENQCQSLATAIIGEQTIELKKRWPMVLQVHDELVACVPENKAEQCLQDMLSVMSQPPTWWPDLAVGAEGKIVDRYGDAKG